MLGEEQRALRGKLCSGLSAADRGGGVGGGCRPRLLGARSPPCLRPRVSSKAAAAAAAAPWPPDSPNLAGALRGSGVNPPQRAPLSPCFDLFFLQIRLQQLFPSAPRLVGSALLSGLLLLKQIKQRLGSLCRLPARCQVNPTTFSGDDINLQWCSAKAPHPGGAGWHP